MITSDSDNASFFFSLNSFAQFLKYIRLFPNEVYPGESGKIIHNNIGISFSTKTFSPALVPSDPYVEVLEP